MGNGTQFALDEDEARLRALRDALEVGERSGASTPFDFDAFLQLRRRRL